MRRSALLLLGTLGLLLGVLTPAGPAVASDEAAVFSWPVGPVAVGDPASLTVTGVGLVGSHQVYVWEQTGGGHVLVSSAEVLTPEQPVATVALPTSEKRRYDFYVEVANTSTAGDALDSDLGGYRVLGRATVVTASIPSGTFRLGASAPVTGTVTGAPGRPVQLQGKTASGWISLGQVASAADGTFSINAPTWWVNRTTLRVFAPATAVDQPKAGGDTGSIHVTRGYRPRGGTAWSYIDRNRARWDPCTVIRYRVNPDRMPRHGLANVKQAFRRLSAATGLRFAYAGRTRFVPLRRGHESDTPRGAEIAVAWATPRMVPALAGSTIGYGGGSTRSVNGGPWWFRSGYAVLDSTARLHPGFAGGRYTWGSLYLHELGHAVGLGHADDRRQIMHSGLEPVAGQYAAGDLRGLVALGARQGCASTAARPLPWTLRAVVGSEAPRMRRFGLGDARR